MAQTVPLIWLVVGASLYGMATRVAMPPIPWIGLPLLLHYTRSMPVVPGFAFLWLAMWSSMAIARRGAFPMPGAIYFAVMAAEAVVVTLAFAVDRAAAPRLRPVLSTLVFPMTLVAVEFLRSRLPGASSWGSIAYSQYGFLPLMQLAAFLGIWGITFAMAWFASTLEFAWSRGFDWTQIRLPVAACTFALGGILTAGYARLAFAPTDRASLRAVTLNRPIDLFAPGEMTRISEGRLRPGERPIIDAKLSRLHDWFLEGSRREARAGARLVVWPEQNLLIFKEDEPAFLERARRVAADERVYLAMGMGTIYLGDPRPFENKLVLIDPRGRVAATHVKGRPVPGWEASIMRRGDGQLSIAETDAGRMAAAICFEADFPELIRQTGQRNADLLILPVNEWKAIKDVHFQMHAFRAIENGVPLVRAAASGISAAVDPWGRVLGMSDYFGAGDGTMTAQVPIGHVPTLYPKTGDLLSWLCVAGLAIVLALSLIR